MNDRELVLSPLGHTWLFDIDGTIVKHNGYKIDGYDTVLPGVLEFFAKIPERDTIILLTSREEKFKGITEECLKGNGIRYDSIIYNLPYGERVIVNDDKPSGLPTSVAVRLKRDEGIPMHLKMDDSL